MIPVKIGLRDINIKNIEPEELYDVLGCVNESDDSLKALGRSSKFSLEDIKQRYLESLINSLEFFCGIYVDKKIIGIIKGRIENKNKKELFIQSLILLEKYRLKGIGTKVLDEFEKYFYYSYSIDRYCAVVVNDNFKGHHFWAKNQYKLARMAHGVNESAQLGIMILEKRATKLIAEMS